MVQPIVAAPMATVPHALVTGGAGFIGSHVVDRLLAEGWRVTAIDDFDPFYAAAIKRANVAEHLRHPAYRLVEGDLLNSAVLAAAEPADAPFTVVVHLAAKAGVRPSLIDPMAYHRANVTGTLVMLGRALAWGAPHIVLASSSSVYGEDPGVPWREQDCRERPISPYAATKVMAERYAREHAHRTGLRTTALRFFTVYGPRQRPDLAIHQFTRAIIEGRPIKRFGDGGTRRDYTYIDDIVNGVMGAIRRTAGEAFEVYNLGNSGTVTLNELIAAIERTVGRKAVIEQHPEQPGDVPQTYADVSKAGLHLGFVPSTPLSVGLEAFHRWFLQAKELGILP